MEPAPDKSTPRGNRPRRPAGPRMEDGPAQRAEDPRALARAADCVDSRQAATLVRRSCLPPLALRIVW